MPATIPLPRTLHQGMRGSDVGAMQRALRQWRRAVRPTGPTNSFGGPTVLQLKRFQMEARVPATGWYGPRTHAALAPHYDAYGALLMQNAVAALHPQKSLRDLVVMAAVLGYHNRAMIHYTQDMTLRMQAVRERLRPPRFPTYADCSSFTTWCYYAAGAPDPNGRGYDGTGYTGTQYPNGTHVSMPQPADLVFYGGGGGVPEHVAVYVGNGMIVSQGSEAGPLLLSVGYRADGMGIRSYL